MTLSMNREIAIEWIERLESLDPELQGDSVLKDSGGRMCCLGVLSEIACEKGIMESRQRLHGGYHEYYPAGSDTPESYGEARYLPKPVIEWAEVDSRKPIGSLGEMDVTDNNPHFQGEYAAVMNDSLRMTFVEIAAALRKELNIPKED